MRYFIKHAISLGIWNSLDVQFAHMLINTTFPLNTNDNGTTKTIVLMIASAYLSAHVRSGHTCLPVYLLSSIKLLKNYTSQLTYKKIKQLTVDDWKELLFSLPTVSNGLSTTPLVLENHCLYLHRMWQDECTVAQYLNNSSKNINFFQKEKITNILNQLFPNTSEEINKHKIAIALSLLHSNVFISGGPGTGKTWTIAKILTAFLLYNNNLKIQTVASTGKAAAVLTYACENIISDLEKLDNLHKYKPTLKTITVHSLLRSQLYKYNKSNFSVNMHNLDVLIIDEASMISLSILSKLIVTLSHHTKVIFLGDQYQLYSIEPGSVFHDICQFSNFDYSLQQQNVLKKLTGYTVINTDLTNKNYPNNTIIDRICVLKKNYRFHKNSGIGQLAYAVKFGDYNKSLSILTSGIYTDLHYTNIKKKEDYISMIMHCSKKYCKYFTILKNHPISVINVLKIFNNYRILCALQHGIFGIIQLNYYIEQTLHHMGLIKLKKSQHYIGKPIIILCNDSSLKLYNGDIGILLPNKENSLSAYFLIPKNKIKIVKIHQLPQYTTCFAMTIHKAQGSEFQNISIILPNQNFPLLTRELIYTAITRTHQKLFLYAKKEVLIYSIKNITKRYSGLYNKIKKNIYN